MQDTHELFHFVIRVPKEESAFTYFILEASEGPAFYSTLEDSLGEGYRDIEIKGSSSLKNEIAHLIDHLKEQYPLEILVNEIIPDQIA